MTINNEQMLAEKAVSNVSTDHLFLEIFNSSKTPSLLLVPNETNFTIQFANEAYLQLFCGYKEDCLHHNFTAFLDKKLTAVNSAALLASAINSIKTKLPIASTHNHTPYNRTMVIFSIGK